jgi:Ca2+-binding EF-hand superfamily protein
VYIEVMLNEQGITLQELFNRYDTDGSGYMSHEEFTDFMKALPLDIR